MLQDVVTPQQEFDEDSENSKLKDNQSDNNTDMSMADHTADASMGDADIPMVGDDDGSDSETDISMSISNPSRSNSSYSR